MKSVGIDIGSSSINVAVAESSSKGYAVLSVQDFPLSPDPRADRALEIIDTLRKIADQFDHSTTKFCIAIPQRQVSLRLQQFPFKERQKIVKSLAFELEDEIPLAAEDTIYDAKIVQFVGEGSEVLTCACPKEDILNLLQVCKDGGFDPELVSVEGLALSNVFEKWQQQPPQTSAPPIAPTNGELPIPQLPRDARLVFHFGHTHSLVMVYRQEVLVSVRSLFWGSHDIALKMVQQFNLPYHEALKILRTKGYILMNPAGSTKDQVLLSQIITNAVEEFCREIRLGLLELRSELNLHFTHIDLLGQLAYTPHIGAFITQQLELPANLYRHFERSWNLKFTPAPEQEAQSALAISLAIEGLKKPRNPAINLRKQEFALQNQTLQKLWDEWKVVGQLAATGVAMFLLYAVVRDSLATRLNDKIDEVVVDITKTLPAPPKGSAKSEWMSKYIDKQKKLIKASEALAKFDNYSSALEILYHISEKMPLRAPKSPGYGIDVSKLSIENDELMIQGRSLSPDQIKPLKEALAQLNGAKSLQEVKSDPVVPGPGHPFAFKVKLNRTN